MDFPSYQNLIQRSKEIALYSSTSALLGWDQETCIPKKGLNYRAEQCAFLGGKAHSLFTDPQVGDWISCCENEGSFADPVELANLREWRWSYDRAVKLSPEFIEEAERVRSHAMSAWAESRKTNDFNIFAPHLEKIIKINQMKAESYGYSEHPYDALIEGYERGSKTKNIKQLFDRLKPELREIGQAAARKSENSSSQILKANYPINAQKEFNYEIAESFGFDFEGGRIDEAVHPFCSGIAPGDTRLTTRYDIEDFSSSLYGVLHEVGHGLYEQGLPVEKFATPSGNSISLGIHESQSRLWENHVGRAPSFWNFWYPKATKYFPSLENISREEIIYSTLRSEPSFIRVEADEATYDLHIILRFEIEKELISGDLKVADLPECWNAKFKEFFGLCVENDADGCLQDIHWSMGALGYFPTYTIGNLGAAQLYSKAIEDEPEILTELNEGKYTKLLDWLRINIHSKGSLLLPDDLIKEATGENLSESHHLEHLKRRYL
ncbi:MAG: carboxypeptidase M32 [Verrucomicrobiota bacterium]|nr:carboxypeptidase M32 [Verrucomicrobiota bacterium]